MKHSYDRNIMNTTEYSPDSWKPLS